MDKPPPLLMRNGLLAEARHVVLPAGIVSTGFPSVRETCRRIGIEFDPWQVDLNKCVLAKNAEGLYAADTVVISIPRQVGKTFDIGALVFALCIKTPNMTVVWTAHRFKVSRETFTELRGMAKSPKLTPHLDYDEITTAAGNECIPFRNGSRIVFAARERGAIRGFTKVAVLILDEAQILTHSVLADLAPTMNQAENPLIILMGTPPKPTDAGEVFTDLRTSALEGSSEELLYVEFSAPDGSDPDDREALRVANPSYPTRTPDRAIRRLRRLLTDPDDFLREVFGIWDSVASGSAINIAAWEGLTIPAVDLTTVTAFGIAVSRDREWASIGAAGPLSDENILLECVEHRPGPDWVVARCIELNHRWSPAAFVIDPVGPAASLVDDLVEAGLNVETTDTADIAIAFTDLIDAVKNATIRHGPQPELLTAVKSAKKRDIGDGLVALGRKASGGDITPIEAVELALWGHNQFGAVSASAYVL